MKRVLALILITLSSVILLLLVQFIISERDHWTYTYSEISCGNCSQDGIVSDYTSRAAIYSLHEKELTFFWLLSFILAVLGIVYVILTNFGKSKNNPLEVLNKENEFIRKQIEKRELLVKLENLEKK